MIISIDTQTTEDANTFGEILRNYAFKEKTGCYSCFDLRDEFRSINDLDAEIGLNLQKAMRINYDTNYPDDERLRGRGLAHYFTNGEIHLAWYWDGDGTLAIIENNRCAVNFDCKRDNCWEWVEL